MEESNRQKKIAGILQEDVATILQDQLRENGTRNLIVSVTKVTVTPDLAFAKVYISVFPAHKAEDVVAEIKDIGHLIKHETAKKVRHQLRRMPELSFYNDNTLEYLGEIDEQLKGKDNPITNPELLPKRKKS